MGGDSKVETMTSSTDALEHFYQGSLVFADPTTLYYANSVTFSSDARLKQNIGRVMRPLESIKKINGVYFRWKDPTKNAAKGVEIGVIAQDLLDSVPSAVQLVEKEDKDGQVKSYYQVDYNNICSVLVEGIKELTERSKSCNEIPSFQSLASRIANLRANLTNLHELEAIADARIQEHTTSIEKLRFEIAKMKQRLE